jgi:hypothetical protein
MTIKQISVFIENRTGRINEVTRILAANGINMTAYSLAESAEFGILRMIVSDVELAVKVLKEAHFGISVNSVICVTCANRPGALATILEYLAQEDVFIEYMYAFSQGETANIVIRPTDVERGVEILSRHECGILNSRTLNQV